MYAYVHDERKCGVMALYFQEKKILEVFHEIMLSKKCACNCLLDISPTFPCPLKIRAAPGTENPWPEPFPAP